MSSMDRVKAKLADFKKDKEEISALAKGHEEARDTASKNDGYFDFAELLLQIAIVLASVAMLTKARWAFYASLALVAVGLFFTVNGYTLFLRIGFME